MKRTLIFILLSASCAFAQSGNVIFEAQTAGPIGAAGFMQRPGAPVQGAPYSATMTTQSVLTLADGNRIVQNSTGSTARDSQGRTRQDTALPPIGNLAAADAPHIVFILDPVAQTSFTLNLTDKTAQKMPLPPAGGFGIATGAPAAAVKMQAGTSIAVAGPGIPLGMPPSPPPPGFFLQTFASAGDPSQMTTEDLGSQTMEGVPVTGTRTTHTIPAGEIGNDRPITVVTEVWTSADLRAVVYSKRTDPRMGEQIFQLTNIVRAEPDASLFTVPAEFKVVDAPQPTIIYRQKQ